MGIEDGDGNRGRWWLSLAERSEGFRTTAESKKIDLKDLVFAKRDCSSVDGKAESQMEEPYVCRGGEEWRGDGREIHERAGRQEVTRETRRAYQKRAG